MKHHLKHTLTRLYLAIGLTAYSLTAIGVEVGSPAPEFELPHLQDGATVSLADLRGKVVFVDFWASWCGPCRKSMPLYETLYQSIDQDQVIFIAINTDEDPNDGIRFLDRYPVSYTVLADSTGQTPQDYGLKAMPSSFLIDTNGVLRYQWIGFREKEIDELRDGIETLLREISNAEN